MRGVRRELTNTTKQVKKARTEMTIFGNSVKDARKFNMGALQQAGYQVGDYAVQVAVQVRASDKANSALCTKFGYKCIYKNITAI